MNSAFLSFHLFPFEKVWVTYHKGASEALSVLLFIQKRLCRILYSIVRANRLSVKDQLVGALILSGHTVSVITTEPCCCSMKATTDSTLVTGRGCVPIKHYRLLAEFGPEAILSQPLFCSMLVGSALIPVTMVQKIDVIPVAKDLNIGEAI